MKKGAEIWVEEGLRLFAEKGIEGLKVAPLSRSVGVAKSSFYYFFESPEGFFEEIIDFWVNEYTVKAFELSELENNPKYKFCSFAAISFKDKVSGSFHNQLMVLSIKDEFVRKKMNEVRGIRERYMISLFVEVGFDEALVREKSEILFSLNFGWAFRNMDKSLTDIEVTEGLGEVWDSMVGFLKGSLKS